MGDSTSFADTDTELLESALNSSNSHQIDISVDMSKTLQNRLRKLSNVHARKSNKSKNTNESKSKSRSKQTKNLNQSKQSKERTKLKEGNKRRNATSVPSYLKATVSSKYK